MWPSAGDSAAALNAWVPTASQLATDVSGGPGGCCLALLELAPPARTATAAISSSAKTDSLHETHLSRRDEIASTTRSGVEPGALRGALRVERGRRDEDEEADLVLGDVDRSLEADARPLARQLLGGRAGTPLARAPLCGGASCEEGFDEVARHSADARGGRHA